MPSIVRSAIFLMFATLAALPGQVIAAGVGVTSAAAGDPVGQPPAAAERILRVGIDVEANERVTTSAEDRAHLVFLDGTSVTIGPNSVLTIDKFVFDPAAGKGDMGVTLTKGVFRLVGGKISKSNEITIATPAATIGIRGSIVTVNVENDGRTTADFLHGEFMRVTAQGETQTAKRYGSRVEVSMFHQPSHPTLLPPGALSATAKLLEKSERTSTVAKTPATVRVSESIQAALSNAKLLNSKEGQKNYAEAQRKGATSQGQKGSIATASAGHTPAILKIAAPTIHKTVPQATHGLVVTHVTTILVHRR
jgi:hypothetical protein